MSKSLTIGSRAENEEPFTVSQLNRKVKQLLWKYLPSIRVEGEVSNLAKPSSGHIYFTLKDAEAQIRCAMFRPRQRGMNFSPKNGDQVLVKAQVSIYEPRGDYQLIVEKMEESGDGALRRAFEYLKNSLSKEGLFNPEHKKSLPGFPHQIGIITSPSGAALHDCLTVLKRRFASIPVVIYPVSVQGKNAVDDIVNAFQLANQRNECDILILTRGGGSLEDLWVFNEELTARAIFECRIPVVTGIGHEIDFTIADFVADIRAATPSAAAETISPDGREWLDEIIRIEQRSIQLIEQTIQYCKQQVIWLNKRLDQQKPSKRLQDQSQRLDDMELRMKRTIFNYLIKSASQVDASSARLFQHNPRNHINLLLSEHKYLSERLHKIFTSQLENRRLKLTELSHTLDAVSPLSTLKRGYGIVMRDQDQKIVNSYQQVNPGEKIQAKLANGRLKCTVEESFDE